MPFVAKINGDKNIFKCPNFGDYRPKGWTLKQKWLVDKNGYGADIVCALASKELLAKVIKGKGYAIIKEARYQMIIGVFER